MENVRLALATSADASLEHQYQHLSPLDAFKAKGRYLHSQLSKKCATDNDRISTDSLDEADAFALDQKLQDRKSTRLLVPKNQRAPSIRSEIASIGQIDRSPSSKASRSRYSNSSASSYGSSTDLHNAPLQGSDDDPASWHSHAHTSPGNGKSRSGPSPAPALSKGNSPAVYASLKSFDKASEVGAQLKNVASDESPGGRFSTKPPLRVTSAPRITTPSFSPISSYGSPSTPRHDSPDSRTSREGVPAIPARTLSYDTSTTTTPRRPSSTVLPGSGRSLRASSARIPTLKNSRLSSLSDAKLSAATHIELGIEQHEANELPQSTHHFKVAADMGDPTGCLLYGLSLRHGWGIRQDLPKSILHLQKAVESLGLDCNDVRGSQLLNLPLTSEVAVAIYELGVSYKNGWGVTADKKLALKYFELASSWGDSEAMVVAADCYLQGEGCKKDKCKAAGYLRKAEAQGKKEIGNSWIWKSKYDEK